MKASELFPRTTPFALPDEKAMGLLEVEAHTEDGKSIHRYQVIYVIREDVQTAYVVDLGSRILFPGPPLSIPAFMEHTVAELQDIADAARERGSTHSRIKELEQKAAEGDIIKEFLEQKERNERIINNRSHLGPKVRHQRNGFSRRK